MKNDDLKDPKKRENDAPKGDGSGAVRKQADALKAAAERAAQAAREIIRQFDVVGKATRKELYKVVRAFQTELLPRRKSGRKPRAEITAAFMDWKAGVRGVRLYERHIPNYARLSSWRREDKKRRLMAAIRSRRRRASIQLPFPTKKQ